MELYCLIESNHINPNNLTFSEASIIAEEILCKKIRESIYRLLPYKKSSGKGSSVEDDLTALLTNHKPKHLKCKILKPQQVIENFVYSSALSEFLELVEDIYRKKMKEK